MFRIRRETWEALARRQEAVLEQAAIEHVGSTFPRVAAETDPAALRLSVRAAIERARGYGLDSARDLFLFVNLCVAYGWDFGERPEQGWIRAMLRDPGITAPSARLAALRDRLRSARRAAAARAAGQGLT